MPLKKNDTNSRGSVFLSLFSLSQKMRENEWEPKCVSLSGYVQHVHRISTQSAVQNQCFEIVKLLLKDRSVPLRASVWSDHHRPTVQRVVRRIVIHNHSFSPNVTKLSSAPLLEIRTSRDVEGQCFSNLWSKWQIPNIMFTDAAMASFLIPQINLVWFGWWRYPVYPVLQFIMSKCHFKSDIEFISC